MKRRGFLVALAMGSSGCATTALRDGESPAETESDPDEPGASSADADGMDSATETDRSDGSPDPADSGGGATDTSGGGPADAEFPQAEKDISVEFRPDEHVERESIRVGDGVPSDDVRPHEVVVWNDGPGRVIRVDVSADARDLNVSRSVALAEDEYLTFRLTEQVDYRVLVGSGDGGRYRFDLSDGFVDCNGSRTTVRVPPSGPVEYVSISTTMACHGPDDDGVSTATEP